MPPSALTPTFTLIGQSVISCTSSIFNPSISMIGADGADGVTSFPHAASDNAAKAVTT